MNPSPTWCVMPFSHLNLKPYGEVGACWRNLDSLGDYRVQPLHSIWNGPKLRELRRQLNLGLKPEGCRSCWDMEAAGTTSTREQCNQHYSEAIHKIADPTAETQPLELASIEVRVSNKCNLSCRHCGPYNSSRWEKLAGQTPELASLFDQHLGQKIEPPVPRLPQSALNELCEDILPNVKHIRLTGGEALIQSEHLEILKRIAPYSQSKILEYNSNLHTLSYRGEHFLKYWKNYKQLIMRVSLDGDTDTYEYFRINGNLAIVEKNIALLQQAFSDEPEKLFLQATCTTSIFQITRLASIARYFTSLGLYFHTSLVQYPGAINIQCLPKSLRERVFADLDRFLISFPEDESFWRHSYWQVEKRRQRQIKRIRQYIGSCLAYLRASTKQDDSLDQSSREWITAMDSVQNSQFLQVYPEFIDHWPKPGGENKKP